MKKKVKNMKKVKVVKQFRCVLDKEIKNVGDILEYTEERCLELIDKGFCEEHIEEA